MKPDAAQILRGIRSVLLETVAPDVQTPAVRAQVGYAIALLDVVAQESEGESERLLQEIDDLQSVLAKLAPLLGGAVGEESAPASSIASEDPDGEPVATPRFLRTQSERLRDALAHVVAKVYSGDGEDTLPEDLRHELDAALRRIAGARRGYQT